MVPMPLFPPPASSGGQTHVYDVTAWPYNADKTGATDATVAIQTAIDAAYAAGGGTVYLPNGTYKVSRQSSSPAECLFAKTGVIIQGESLGAILKLEDDAGDAARVIITHRPALAIANAAYTIETLEIDEVETRVISKEAHGLRTGDGPILLGSSDTPPGGLALSTEYWIVRYDDGHFEVADSYDNALLHRVVTITDDGVGDQAYENGVDCVRPSTDMQFRNFSIDGNKWNNTVQEHRHGIFVFQAARMVFENLRIYDCTGDGIAFSGGHDAVVKKCHIYGCERTAVDFIGFPSNRVTTSNCEVEGNRDGFHIELSDLLECTDVVVENVTCGPPSGTVELALSCSSPVVRFTIRNCVCYAPLSIQEGTDVLIENCEANQFKESTTSPLEIGSSTNVMVRNTTIRRQATPLDTRYTVSVQECDGVAFDDCRVISDATNCTALTVIDSSNVTWDGGSMECTVSANGLEAVNCFAVDANVSSIRLRDVHFKNWSVAGVIAIGDPGTATLTGVWLIDNLIEPSTNTPRGWHFDQTYGGATKVVERGSVSTDDSIVMWSSHPVGGDGLVTVAGVGETTTDFFTPFADPSRPLHVQGADSDSHALAPVAFPADVVAGVKYVIRHSATMTGTESFLCAVIGTY